MVSNLDPMLACLLALIDFSEDAQMAYVAVASVVRVAGGERGEGCLTRRFEESSSSDAASQREKFLQKIDETGANF